MAVCFGNTYLKEINLKINLVSDIHLEFGYQTLPGGDVLIIAGDLAEVRSILRHKREWLSLTDEQRQEQRYKDLYKCWVFFEQEIPKYQKVFYVLGNHEHYHSHLHKTWTDLITEMPDNLTVLDDHYEIYNGVLFVGSTLWTDLNRGDPNTAFTLKNFMADFKVITQYNAAKQIYHKLAPEYTAEIHLKSKKFIAETLEANPDLPAVVITHHAPSFASVNEKYKDEKLTNGGYASELSELILDHPQIKYWCHGHMHDPVEYEIGTTKVVSNPRGYVGYEDVHLFSPYYDFEI